MRRTRPLCIFAAIAFALTTFAARADFFDGLVMYLPFDENGGNKAEDVSGLGHDGDIDNAEWVAGKSGSALYFGGEPSLAFVTIDSTAELKSTK